LGVPGLAGSGYTGPQGPTGAPGAAATVGTITATGATVTNAVSNNPAGPNQVRLTVPGHGIAAGTWIVISGVLGVPTANGSYTANVIDPNTIDLSSTFSGAYVSGGIVSTQANAAQLFNTWTRVTSGGTGAGVQLPTGTAGNPPFKIKNATGNSGLVVWGVTGAGINAVPVNRPITVPSDWTAEFWASSNIQWDTQP
jgi:hypothetical protein